jgi:TolB-like protein
MAVLPFANLTGDPEQEYLSDGFTQELIAQLGRLRPERMSVIGRTSVMRYKKGETPLEQIARELAVGYVLGGSCRRESARVRISVELIRARDQAQLWSETYEREMSGLLALQSDIARRVAEALALRLLPGDEERLAQVRSVDPEAYEAYLKGVQQRSAMTRAGFDEAERYFNLAIEKDPGYAAPWAGVSATWVSRVQLNMAPREEGLIKAKSAALKALALDDQEVEARQVLFHVRRFDEAIAMARKALSVQPSVVARSALTDSLFKSGRHDEVSILEREGWAKDPQLTEASEQGFAANGFSGAQRGLADALAARYGRPGSVTAYTLANYYARAGDGERVIEWLEKAYLEHNNNLPYMRTPVFDLVRSDPRFQDLLRRIGLPGSIARQ